MRTEIVGESRFNIFADPPDNRGECDMGVRAAESTCERPEVVARAGRVSGLALVALYCGLWTECAGGNSRSLGDLVAYLGSKGVKVENIHDVEVAQSDLGRRRHQRSRLACPLAEGFFLAQIS